jgi:hypothetical protein
MDLDPSRSLQFRRYKSKSEYQVLHTPQLDSFKSMSFSWSNTEAADPGRNYRTLYSVGLLWNDSG